MAYAVKFEHVTKRYPRGWSDDEGPRYASLRHDVSSIGRRLAAKGRSKQGHGTLALEDVSFEVEEGESFALIGPNGAGKSTALKMISRISYPTEGRVRIRGRVAALMEVGSGVHPELTGRENIWLYGQILGLRKGDIRRRFDEIVEFAELAHAIDTPVKFYSTGMQLRLGFSIASHLEPDVFVVDEALAVGDAGFQARCVERMTKLVAQGHTLMFVSHNLPAIEAMCSRAVFLDRGRILHEGSARQVLGRYISWLESGRRREPHALQPATAGGGPTVREISLHGADGAERYSFARGDDLEVRLLIDAPEAVDWCLPSVGISDGRSEGLIICSTLEDGAGIGLRAGSNLVSCFLHGLPLADRTYEVWFSIREAAGVGDLVGWSEVAVFRVGLSGGGDQDEAAPGPAATSLSWMAGPVRVPHRWSAAPAD